MGTQSTPGFSDAVMWVAGVDEVGRGPLAGPVVTAAVILDPERPVSGLADSKVLKIGRASCRERVEISVVAVSLKKKQK